jgi:hypothetical protein
MKSGGDITVCLREPHYARFSMMRNLIWGQYTSDRSWAQGTRGSDEQYTTEKKRRCSEKERSYGAKMSARRARLLDISRSHSGKLRTWI